MKPRKLGKKLALSKTTIVNLEQKEQGAVKGGYWHTECNEGCRTWHPVCFTMPYDCSIILETLNTCRIQTC